jgi:hypothetical protein
MDGWAFPYSRLFLFDTGADNDAAPFIDVGLEQHHQFLWTARLRLKAQRVEPSKM